MWRKRTSDKRVKTKQVVFSLDIDFNYQAREMYGKLEPGQTYNFSGLKRTSEYQNHTNYSGIVDYVVNIVNNELKSQYQECTDILIEQVKVIKTYRGSINVIFSVIFSALGVVSGLKDLYDCIELIKVMSDAYIKNRMEDKYGDLFDIRTRTIVPNRESIYHKDIYYINDESRGIVPVTHKSRDTFFYYLLISNIVLLAVIGLLVYKAVLTMYW